MVVAGRIYIGAPMLEKLGDDPALTQVANVACLPGIVGYSLAMPDIHRGYGFPIGGVAAIDARIGAISPGGVGYDINCGVPLARTNLRYEEVAQKVDRVADALFNAIPAGVGSEEAIPTPQYRRTEATPPRRCRMDAPPRLCDAGGPRSHGRGSQRSRINGAASSLGRWAQAIIFWRSAESTRSTSHVLGRHWGSNLDWLRSIDSGSRGLGHQICEVHLKTISSAMTKYEIVLPDRQLAAVPSPEGQDYLGAMTAAANFAWCNRQIMMHLATDAFMEALGISPRDRGLTLIYDVCHNIAKFEDHVVDGMKRVLCVHRKGATRARAMRETRGRDVFAELVAIGVTVRAQSRAGVAEEMQESYKDVAYVVEVLEAARVTQGVARLKPFW